MRHLPLSKAPWFIPIIIALALLFTVNVLSRNSAKRAAASIPVAVPLAASPQPRITWSQQEVKIALSPGESASRDVTFMTSLEVQNIIIQAVPAIAGFVSIQPNSIATVPAIQPQSIHLAFSIPTGTALKTYEAYDPRQKWQSDITGNAKSYSRCDNRPADNLGPSG